MNYQDGVMPTTEWFEKINEYVEFKGKSVVDYGCAEGIMCMLAHEAGASKVLGIDEQEEYGYWDGVEFRKEKIGNKYESDIKIFSMIIHWIGKEIFLSLADSSELVVIFREPNSGYQIPINGKWFPTLKELNKTLKDFRLLYTEILMEQDNGKKIRLAIYDRKEG